ncbi:MAG: hypothetical protein AAB477_00235 [Patescibacteria group bacterium]
MENNPKKSKALIITIIAIVVLVAALYFLFKNSDKIFGTKDTAISRLFAPLLGSSKKKAVDTVNNTNTEQGGGTTEDTSGTVNNGTNEVVDVNTGNNPITGGVNPITPPLTPLPTPGNDTASGGYTPAPITNNDISPLPPIRAPIDEPKICPVEEELEYTNAEKDQLAELLRQYYLIAPELKTAGEVAMINDDVRRNQDLIDHADTLTLQCTAQKVNPKYAGPSATKNNPYYGNLNIKPEFYAPKQFNSLEDELNIW